MDEAIKKIVSGRLKRQAPGPHPDPELLAAYAENSLSPKDRRSLVTHLSACADCRDCLYLAMPELETQPVLRPSYKSPRFAVGWATVAASIIVAGAVLLADRGMFYQHSPTVERYTQAPTQNIAALKEPTAGQPAPEPRDPETPAAAKVRPPLKHMTAKPQGAMLFDQSGQVHLSAPAAAASDANKSVAARMSSESAPASQQLNADKVSAQADWSLSADGNVQRSLDAGKTWQVVPVSDSSQFRAITALGDDIWVGGNAGALYHSANSGLDWVKLNLASTDDVTRIEFTDPQNGSLNTANGQVWSTSDGGRTWHSK